MRRERTAQSPPRGPVGVKTVKQTNGNGRPMRASIRPVLNPPGPQSARRPGFGRNPAPRVSESGPADAAPPDHMRSAVTTEAGLSDAIWSRSSSPPRRCARPRLRAAPNACDARRTGRTPGSRRIGTRAAHQKLWRGGGQIQVRIALSEPCRCFSSPGSLPRLPPRRPRRDPARAPRCAPRMMPTSAAHGGRLALRTAGGGTDPAETRRKTRERGARGDGSQPDRQNTSLAVTLDHRDLRTSILFHLGQETDWSRGR